MRCILLGRETGRWPLIPGHNDSLCGPGFAVPHNDAVNPCRYRSQVDGQGCGDILFNPILLKINVPSVLKTSMCRYSLMKAQK